MRLKILGMLLIILFPMTTFSMENAFYILRKISKNQTTTTSSAMTSLNQHYSKINILISQAYYIDAKGNLKGAVDQSVLDFAKKNNIKVLILVTNAGFNRKVAHLFLKNKKAQTKMIETLLQLCQKNHFDGVQLDFEAISLMDKNALTQFGTQLANCFHHNKLLVSFAVIPLVTNDIHLSLFLKRKYENWGGAYDLSALGKIGDFITLMSYDQHESGTTPGPYAGLPWVEATIQYALKFIPAEKISLGIPVYSSYWKTNTSVNVFDLTSNQVNAVIKKHKMSLTWDNFNKVNYAVFLNHWLNEYLFVEDARSFKEKILLVKKYHLRGISVFDLGIEDPGIWEELS